MTRLKIFSDHPRGLAILSLVCGAERAAHYGCRAVLFLFLASAFFDRSFSTQVFYSFCAAAYIAPLLGGYLADRIYGSRNCVLAGGLLMTVAYILMYWAAAVVKQSIFFEGGTPVMSVDNTWPTILMSFGLVLLVIGTGLFKPMSAMVSQLYAKGDAKVDTAYSILYGCFNLCGMFGPIACGIWEGNWHSPSTFKGAFLAAAVMQIISVVIYMLFRNDVKDVNGNLIGLRPEKRKENITSSSSSSGYSWERILLCVIVGMTLLALLGRSVHTIPDALDSLVLTCSACFPLMLLLDRRLSSRDRMHMIVIFFLTFLSVAYWSVYELSATSLTLLVKDHVIRTIYGFKVPASWYQSLNPIFVIFLSLTMPRIWKFLGRHEPGDIAKQVLGFVLLSAGFAVIYFAVGELDSVTKISMIWIVGMYFLHAVSEMCLSVTGMSLVMKLSPGQMTGMIMALWLSSSGVANVLSGKLASLYYQPGEPPRQILGFFTIESMSDYMLIMVIIPIVAAVILACATPVLNRIVEKN